MNNRPRGIKRWTVRLQLTNGRTYAPIDVPARFSVDDVRTVMINGVRFARVREFQDKPEILD